MLQRFDTVEQLPLGGQITLSQHLLYLILKGLPDTQAGGEGVSAVLAELNGAVAAIRAGGRLHQLLFQQRVQVADDGGAV